MAVVVVDSSVTALMLLYNILLQTAHRSTAYTKHGNCRSRVEAPSLLGPSETQQGGVGNVSVRGIYIYRESYLCLSYSSRHRHVLTSYAYVI